MKKNEIIEILEEREEEKKEERGKEILNSFLEFVLFAAVFIFGALGGYSEAQGISNSLLIAGGFALAGTAIRLFLDSLFEVKP